MRCITQTETMTLKLAGAVTANQPTWHTTFVNTTTKLPSDLKGIMTGVTPVTIMAAPASGSYNLIKHLDVVNNDTAPVDLIVEVTGDVTREILRRTLAAGESADLMNPSVKGEKGDTGSAGASTVDDGMMAVLSFDAGAMVGAAVYLVAPFAFTIQRVVLIADATASLTVDIKKSTYAGFPTVASICAAALPALATARKYEDGTLTGWTTAVAKGDVLEFTTSGVSGSMTTVLVGLTGVKP